MTEEENKEEETEEEEEEEETESETEKRLNKVVDKNVDKIISALQEKAEVKVLGTTESESVKSIMETDLLLRKNHPFVTLSDNMEKFISVMKVLVKGGQLSGSLAKALQESDDTAGGFLVPEEFRSEVIRFASEVAIVRSRARVFPMRSNILTLPQLDQSNYRFAGVDLHWEGAEGDEKEESQPKFGRITLKLCKLIGVVPISDDLLSDASINVANYLVSLFGEAIAYEEDTQFLIGNGMKKPQGIVQCGTTQTRETASKITIEDVITMDEVLPAWADSGAVWITTKAGVGQLRRMRADAVTGDDRAGALLFQPSMVAGIPSVLSGKPILLTDKLPAVGTQGDLILGNLSAYFIGDKGGLSVASSIHDRFRHDETVLRFVKRVDGQCAIPSAFVILK